METWDSLTEVGGICGGDGMDARGCCSVRNALQTIVGDLLPIVPVDILWNILTTKAPSTTGEEKTAVDAFTPSPFGKSEPGNWSLHPIPGCSVEEIGQSREGRALYGLCTGHGSTRVSIVAGAHADEPIGPRTALWFAAAIAAERDPWARELAQTCHFRIVPHLNPDGDARNERWQRHPRDFAEYLLHAEREPPGDDVEFSFPDNPGDKETRPENLAAAEFLRAPEHPYHFHASLHGMGVAEGAYFLLCREWMRRAMDSAMFPALAAAARAENLGLHDVDRRGEKGFHRIAPGFCTTPRSEAMRHHFLEQGDDATAALFRPTSMEYVHSLGGDPLCMVSELPLFVIRAAAQSKASLEERPYFAVRDEMPKWRAALAKGDRGPVLAGIRAYGIEPIPWESQRALQVAMLREGISLARGTTLPPPQRR